jgi:hypothetical protein
VSAVTASDEWPSNFDTMARSIQPLVAAMPSHVSSREV